jgi:hypothetical protein
VLKSYENELWKAIKVGKNAPKLPANEDVIRTRLKELDTLLTEIRRWELYDLSTIDVKIGQTQATKIENLLRRFGLLGELGMSYDQARDAIEKFNESYKNPKDSQLPDNKKLMDYAAMIDSKSKFNLNVACIRNYQMMAKDLNENTIKKITCPAAIEEFLTSNPNVSENDVKLLQAKLESLNKK